MSVYDPDTDGHSPERLALLGGLRRALSGDELFLHYQPKVSLSTGEVAAQRRCCAGRTRAWTHPAGRVHPPGREHRPHRSAHPARTRPALAPARRWADSSGSRGRWPKGDAFGSWRSTWAGLPGREQPTVDLPAVDVALRLGLQEQHSATAPRTG